jgi:transcription factor SOX7/8/10/18 (SOX group E/F)
LKEIQDDRNRKSAPFCQMYQPNWQGQAADSSAQADQDADSDTSRRPPNAFILYSQAMRSAVRQENPSLSNTEVSRLLGKMWKDVPAETKLHYKQQASIAQAEFKAVHPDYTYRKARRKRALNELLTKTTPAYQLGNFPTDPNMANPMFNPYFMQMYSQGAAQGNVPTGQLPPGYPNMGMPMMGGQPGYPNIPGYPPMGDQSQNPLYQFQPK